MYNNPLVLFYYILTGIFALIIFAIFEVRLLKSGKLLWGDDEEEVTFGKIPSREHGTFDAVFLYRLFFNGDV